MNICIIFLELHSTMLHGMFQNHRPSGSGEDFKRFLPFDCHGSHLGHVTWTIYTNLRSRVLKMLYIKFGFNSPCGIKNALEYYVHIHIFTLF